MNTGFNKPGPMSDEVETPQWLFDALDSEFGFNLDAAATAENAKCKVFATSHTIVSWAGQRVFCNPPYSHIEHFVRLALSAEAEIAVLLLPVRPDNDWFRLLFERNVELRFFRKRIKFTGSSPRFSSVVAVFRKS